MSTNLLWNSKRVGDEKGAGMNLLLLLACGSEVIYHQDVKPILEARCLNCHVEGSIGSVDLSTVECSEWEP